jgi:hypothetical protein
MTQNDFKLGNGSDCTFTIEVALKSTEPTLGGLRAEIFVQTTEPSARCRPSASDPFLAHPNASRHWW